MSLTLTNESVTFKIQSPRVTYSTVSDMQNVAVPTESDCVTVTDEGQGGTFIYRLSNAAINNGGTIFNGWTREYSGAVNVKWFGVDYNAVISAIAVADANYLQKEVAFDSIKYTMTAGITINPNSVVLKGNGTQLDFSSLVSGNAIWIRGASRAGISYSGSRLVVTMDGFELLGNTSITLIEYSSDSGTQDSRGVKLQNIIFNSFLVGLNIGGNGWGITLDHYSFLNGIATSIQINELEDNAPTVTNFGELNSFTYGIHNGEGTAYKSRNYNSDAYFNNCSLDSCKVVDIARGAKVVLRDCHIENVQDNILFLIEGTIGGFAGAYLSMRDCTLVMPGTFTRNNPIFSVGKTYPVGNGGLTIDGLYIQGTSVTFANKYLIEGNGKTSIRNLHTHYDFKDYALVESGNPVNTLSDGSFEAGIGEWTVPFIAPIWDNTVFRSGASSMKMVGDNSQIQGATITRTVKGGQVANLGVWYKLDAIVQGASAWNKFHIQAKVYNKEGQVMSEFNEEIYFDGTNDWTFHSSAALKNQSLPAGADYIIAAVYTYACTGTAWVDDITLAIID